MEVHTLDRNKVVEWFYKNFYKYNRSIDSNEYYNYLYQVLAQNPGDPVTIVKTIKGAIGESNKEISWKFH